MIDVVGGGEDGVTLWVILEPGERSPFGSFVVYLKNLAVIQ